MAQRAVLSQKGLRWTFIDELVPLLGSPSSSSSGSDDEVVAHDNGSLESGAASPADIIHVDETHSAIPPRAPPVDIHGHHHKRSLKTRSRTSQFSFLSNSTVSSTHTSSTTFQPFRAPAPSISDGYEPCHSAHWARACTPLALALYSTVCLAVQLFSTVADLLNTRATVGRPTDEPK